MSTKNTSFIVEHRAGEIGPATVEAEVANVRIRQNKLPQSSTYSFPC